METAGPRNGGWLFLVESDKGLTESGNAVTVTRLIFKMLAVTGLPKERADVTDCVNACE